MLLNGNWNEGLVLTGCAVESIGFCIKDFFFLKKINDTLSPADLTNNKNRNLPRPREPLLPSSVTSSSPPSCTVAAYVI